MNTYVVERDFGEPLAQTDLEATMEKMGPCLEEYGLDWVHSYFSEDRTRMVCIYESPDAGSVRDANRSAGAPFDRIWKSEILQPEE